MAVSVSLSLSLCLSLSAFYLRRLQHLTVVTMKIIIHKYQDLVIIRMDFFFFLRNQTKGIAFASVWHHQNSVPYWTAFKVC